MPNATRRLPKSLMKSTSSFTASTLPAQGGAMPIMVTGVPFHTESGALRPS